MKIMLISLSLESQMFWSVEESEIPADYQLLDSLFPFVYLIWKVTHSMTIARWWRIPFAY